MGAPEPGGSARTAARGVELVPVVEGERAALDALVDAYLAELGAHRERPVGPTDAASYAYLPLYWSEPGRHPFFLETPAGRAGFALIREVRESGLTQMSDFFVLPAFRRTGLGRAAVAALWRRFPGAWELQVHPDNRAAAAFWPACIAASCAGPLEAVEVVEEDGRRVEYRFVIAADPGPGSGAAPRNP